jgi:lipoyl(octanoyl) transferase
MHIHRGVTTHGFALNVDCDLRGFQAIVACGQAGMETTNLAVELGRPIAMESVMDGIQASLDLSGV